VEHLDDKKILDGFIGMLLPWNSTWPRAMLKFQYPRYHGIEARQVNFPLRISGNTGFSLQIPLGA
jgi:hypothetical protein